MTTTPIDTSGYTWAVFNDEGMLAGQMSYATAALEAESFRADGEEFIVVDRECSEHEEQRATNCEECANDDEDDEEDEEDNDEEEEDE